LALVLSRVANVTLAIFNKASIESGPGIRIYPLESTIETTAMVLKQVGLEKSQFEAEHVRASPTSRARGLRWT
jgi:hypothetical protein